MGTLLRYPYEVRSEKEYFDDIQDVKVTRDMLDLAKHIVEKKSGSFEPDRFEDHYESALIDLINKKRSGVKTTAKAAPKTGGNVINLMDALKRSLASEKQSGSPAKAGGKKPRKGGLGAARDAAADQRQARQGRVEKGGEAGAHPCPVEKGRIVRRPCRQRALNPGRSSVASRPAPRPT